MENSENKTTNKSASADREERILAFWKEKNIFEKSLEQTKSGKPFIFYEGPPTANGKPGIHHLEARAFKDAIPRYKTMQRYFVRRKGGWDTHGLPVELQVEKELGFKSKKDIEAYGIAAFNKKCKESVWTYVDLWTKFTDRIGYWVDQEHPYVTYHNNYIESLWNIVSKVNDQGLLYKDYKVVPWCPRDGTALSSHELAQGYQDDKDISVYVEFKLNSSNEAFFRSLGRSAQPDTQKSSIASISFIAWTTTPWTLPGNAALAVNSDVIYSVIEKKDEGVGELVTFILAKERLSNIFENDEYTIIKEIKGSELVGLEYEPLYPYLSEQISGTEKEKMINAYKVYAADFVTTNDGTGIVHIAPMYGQDDFELGTKVGLPKFHTVDEAGNFIKGTGFLEGRFVKEVNENGKPTLAVDIIDDLKKRNLFFAQENITHSYPHCWRCNTPLIYYARDSWYIGMSKLRTQLIAENEKINWEPAHIKEGRFGEWIKDAKDWAISRERYWGTPLPVWMAEDGEKLLVGSVATLKQYTKKSGNNYFVMRHCQTENNLKKLWSFNINNEDILTAEGKEVLKENVKMFEGKKIDLIIASPYSRTQQTAMLVAEAIGLSKENIITDARIGEWQTGDGFDGKPIEDYFTVRNKNVDRYQFKAPGGESYADVLKRSGEFIYDVDTKYTDKNILIISHGGATRALMLLGDGFSFDTLFATTRNFHNFTNAEIRELSFVPLPHNENYELDLHRPYIDSIVLKKDGKEFKRVKEVMDVWFDSGAMPFAQDHYPFENKEYVDTVGYPADFISEAIDQTRGWFYTLHAVGALMGRGRAYNNVICLGHLLDAKGKKMSKSLGNIVDPWEQIEKYGVDALRLWMYSVNQPGESKNYDEKTVDELVKKIFLILENVYKFYELYKKEDDAERNAYQSKDVLDEWILARLNQYTETATVKLDAFNLFEPVRGLRDFVSDLSTWYVRRSRDRFKEENDDAASARATTYTVLLTLAKLMAPLAPFFAEDLYQKLTNGKQKESVHLEHWPDAQVYEPSVLENMEQVRSIVTLGLEARQKAGIKVRQPLAGVAIKDFNLSEPFAALIRDELNVKAVLADEKINQPLVLDTLITDALKAEGDIRELIRAVQDKRKELGLHPDDTITLTLGGADAQFAQAFLPELQKAVGAITVLFNPTQENETDINGKKISITVLHA